MLGWTALSLLPDLDVIGFRFGVSYADAWGHRGATHSLAFAVGIGLCSGLLAGLTGRSALRLGALATAVVASHGLLDTLTDGGLGVALLWPFDDTRFFAAWRPIPVAPLGLGLLSMRGLEVAVAELVGFVPVIVAVRQNYAHRTAEKELISQYQYFHRIFSNAAQLILRTGKYHTKKEILRALGIAALDESSQWILRQRERPVGSGLVVG